MDNRPDDAPFTDLTIVVFNVCPFCETSRSLEVKADSMRRWKDGIKIQDAFPELTADDREHIQTGTCPKCWDKYMKDDEED